jgi:DMSO/TMAO reductase YedYZ molybdopterin-dependent catalytic subunit
MIDMSDSDLSRRALLKGGGATLAGLSVIQIAGPGHAFPGHDDDEDVAPWDDERADARDDYPGHAGDEVLWWDDQPGPSPPELYFLVWEALSSRLIPNDQFFIVNHYDQPALDPAAWRLVVDGLVDHPASFSLADLKRRSRRDVEFTLECSGNTGLPFAIGVIGNARWAGAQLAPLLKEAGLRDEATEVVFWGADHGTVTVRDNVGVTGGGDTGTVEPDGTGGLDLTFTEQYARSMSLEDALKRGNLLCYEMNGRPLPPEHGSPVRLIAPGWYGVANVKWLTRIQVIDRKYQGRFMARDYVDGNLQPAADDPFTSARRTFWENNAQITRRIIIP